jgi:hypothetical protein
VIGFLSRIVGLCLLVYLAASGCQDPTQIGVATTLIGFGHMLNAVAETAYKLVLGVCAGAGTSRFWEEES